MSAISQVLYDILHARFGKDVRQAIHDGIELGYDIAFDAKETAETAQDSASASATAAANSASAAQTAANNASISAGLAEQYKDEAFHTTPAGYEDFVSETNSNLDYLANTGCKNLLHNTQLVSKEKNGVTITVNDDGSITLNGTATQWFLENLDYVANVLNYPAGNYIGSGALSSGATLHARTNSGNIITIRNTDVAFTIPENATESYLRLEISSGASFNNATLYPMVRLASISDSTYIPYAQSNAALTKRAVLSHNVPRLVPKDITSYITDGTLWQRLNGTNGFELFEDIYCGDYIHMSRAISAYEQTQTYQTTGSDYVTIGGIDTLMGNGDTRIDYHHLVMIPGKGFGGTQHFGRSRMNATNTTVGGYKGSEMFTTTIGTVVSSGSTVSQATINQQLYAEFGTHLKTTREYLSKSINATGYNRYGTNSGCSNSCEWTSCQAVLMSEVECYGATVCSSSLYDTGNAAAQLPLFTYSKEARNNTTGFYWLKDVANAEYFCNCRSEGNAYIFGASIGSSYVRPRFVLAA